MRGIAWKPTGIVIGIPIDFHPLFITRSFYARPLGDVWVGIGLVFVVIAICFSEAWPFMRGQRPS